MADQAGDEKPGMPRPVMARLQKLIGENASTGWDHAWKEGVTPWDLGVGQPPLRDLIESGEIDFSRAGRALVPGAGRGYDAIFIASKLGLDTLALDISPTAVEAGNALVASQQPLTTGSIEFRVADFFTFNVPEDEKFELIYDYTFFVAIPPARRNEWGQRIQALIKPGGYLITLVYPIDPPTEKGPPFFVRPEHYIEPLGEGWQKVLDKVPSQSLETHIGRERLVVWKRL
ncbi:hypothetical protein HGRIS_009640 [Hohenbuehelia grisea]|uniref:Uncharacterized protein n=1 Tax=Hohenbuehelia grisea TaxID=104357 RepID=A0ABR3J263_9AGAR